MNTGTVGILNVGAGDIKLTFDPSNPAEMIRAARIVKDMLRRGYALLVEYDDGGVKKHRRAYDFDEKTAEYIVADFDPVTAAEADKMEEGHGQESAAAQSAPTEATSEDRSATTAPRLRTARRVHASKARGTAVSRTAGG